MAEHTFALEQRLTELRCHSTEWLRARRAELVREQRALKVEELAVTRILDERAAIDTATETLERRDGISPRTARTELEVSRALEPLPAIAAAAHAGMLSWDQLKPLVELATPETDAEWARRAPNCSPIDLERVARRRHEVTEEEAAARREARELRMWWRPRAGMLSVRGELPDVDGALVKSVFERMVNRMRPPKGETWDTLPHRMADAFVDLCTNHSDATPGRTRSHITFHVPASGPAEVDGIPIAESTLARLLPDATITTSIVDDNRLLAPARDTDDIPEATKRFVRARDHHCRVGTCDETRGLDYHHMIPRSQGGTHDPDNIVLAGKPCGHHQMLIPNGPWILAGDPSQPDGLRLVHRDELARAP